MMEPLAVAWHGVKRSGFQPGDKCLVLGSGPVSADTTALANSAHAPPCADWPYGPEGSQVRRIGLTSDNESELIFPRGTCQGSRSRMGRGLRALH